MTETEGLSATMRQRRVPSGLVILAWLGFFVPALVNGQDSSSADRGRAAAEIVRIYEILDIRFCDITPAPFLCRECLEHEEQLVQILRFEADGTPFRSYACRPFRLPFVQ